MSDIHNGQHPASYRDPAGFIFTDSGAVYRAVQPAGAKDYDLLLSSGLYARLLEKSRIIAHEEVDDPALQPGAYKILKPAQLSFWTYPYEWSFSQLRAAALLTLNLVATGLEFGMILKDASAYNIQFVAGKPLLIDSLSFEAYNEGEAWQAFSQMCRHFLYPLLVFHKRPEMAPSVLTAYPDGFSAQLTASLLPWKSRLNLTNQLYVYLAASLGNKKGGSQKAYRISKQKILQNVAQLKSYIAGLPARKTESVWSNYYDETILSDAYLENKKTVVAELLKDLQPKRVIDAGCNTGAFSIIASAHAEEVISFDYDANSIDLLYRETTKQGLNNLHLLVADITNPTPALGWANAERSALTDRIKGDVVLALALIHHLALARNVPFSFISDFFARITGKWLLIEFVPKSDTKAQLLLQTRADIFPQYTAADFESAFQQDFSIEKRIPLAHSERMLYLLKKR